MQIVSIGDNLHEMSKPCFLGEKKKHISTGCLLKLLPRQLNIKEHFSTKSIDIFFYYFTKKRNSVGIF